MRARKEPFGWDGNGARLLCFMGNVVFQQSPRTGNLPMSGRRAEEDDLSFKSSFLCLNKFGRFDL